MTSSVLLTRAGIFLGLGLGGFVDGIILHQVLQWHHLVTSAGYPPDSLANLQVNTFWDGIFHLLAWTFTVIGILLLWRANTSRSREGSSPGLWGGILAGWGIFNLVEGTINHHLLGLHHVREVANPLPWDLGFLALGAALVATGWAIARGVKGEV